VSTTEELLGRKSSGSGLEIREYGRRGPIKKKPYYFLINTEKSGPDLGLATGGPEVRTFDYQARTTLIIGKIFNHIILLR
jgi:hypothetical protein